MIIKRSVAIHMRQAQEGRGEVGGRRARASTANGRWRNCLLATEAEADIQLGEISHSVYVYCTRTSSLLIRVHGLGRRKFEYLLN